MASTPFIDFITPIPTPWLNDTNTVVYTTVPSHTTSINANASAITAETTRATTAEALLAPLASPALTGVPTAPTAVAGTNTTQVSTTAFTTGAIATAVAPLANLASPTFTGIPAAPTAATGTNTTQIATTAFVAASTLGIGQTWQGVIRTAGTTYYNTTGKPIVFSVYGGVTAVGAATATVSVNGAIVSAGAGYAGGSSVGASAIIPPGASYSYALTNITLTGTLELR